MTEWKPIPGYEDRYEITREGIIWSLPRKHHPDGHYMKPHLLADGTLVVALRKGNGKRETRRVHILVAKAFSRGASH